MYYAALSIDIYFVTIYIPKPWRCWSCRALEPEAQEHGYESVVCGSRGGAGRALQDQRHHRQPPHLQQSPGRVDSGLPGLLGVCGACTL